MAKLALGIEYQGTHYCGWQVQANHRSVQAEVERALAKVAQHPVKTYSSGRTDSGVHATGQVVHFETPTQRPDDAWVRGVNSYLPKDIRIQWVRAVDDAFHARFSATQRRYIYCLMQAKISPGILHQSVTWIHYPVDVENMQVAANALIGEHDFSSFRAAQCQAKSPIRHLNFCKVLQQGSLIVVDIAANGFLHHMVRNIVGSLLVVGRGQAQPSFLAELLDKKDRQCAPQMAPASGLYFLGATYPEELAFPNRHRLPWFLSQLSEQVTLPIESEL